MAKTRPQPEQQKDDAVTATAEPKGSPGDNGESVTAYFRRIFTENPKWLEGSSNQEVLKRWLADHPGETEVPNRVKYILSNVKSVLRKKLRQEPGKRPMKERAAETTPVAQVRRPRRAAAKALEILEEQIDECMSLARNLDPEGLASVVAILRSARNQVVWKLGE